MSPTPSPNFAYLAHHDARLVALGTQAEEHSSADPTVTLFKLRQFGEALAQRAAAKVGLFTGPDEPREARLRRGLERFGQSNLFDAFRLLQEAGSEGAGLSNAFSRSAN